MYKSIIDAVLQHSEQYPEKLAAADENKIYSYQMLAQGAANGAAWLAQKGVKPGDCVLVECTQDVDFLMIDLACEYAGVIFVPLEQKAVQERVTDIFRETGAKFIISRTDYTSIAECFSISAMVEEAQKLEAVCRPYEEKEKVAEILFTTGTTGQPKGIIISHEANVAIAENISFGVENKEDTVELIPLPLSHSHGLRTCYANFLNGSGVVVMDGVMNVALFFKLVEKYHVTAFDMSPTLAKLLLKIAKRGLMKCADSIDYIEIGTAVLEDDTKQQLKNIFKGSRLYNFYGSTEAGRSCVLDFNSFDETGCIGYPSKNSVFYIVDEKRQAMESSKDQWGLIAVSGKMMMEAYLNSEELTKETLVDGILYTNDMGYVDEAGRIYVMGRQDDIINYKGIKIAPEEIESVAARYEGIADCACVPKADKICGQVPKLFVSLKNPEQYTEKDFWEFLKSNLEAGRVPESIVVLDEIPRSQNGKLQRKKLRDA